MKHCNACKIKFPNCPCNTCKKDRFWPADNGKEWLCCHEQKHRRSCEDEKPCKHYKKEKARPKTSHKKYH